MPLWVISMCAAYTRGKKHPHNLDHCSNIPIPPSLHPASLRPALPTEPPICTALPFPLTKWDAWMLPVCDPSAATPTEKLHTPVGPGGLPGNHLPLQWFKLKFNLFWLHPEDNYTVSQMLSCHVVGDICHTWKC